TGNDQDETGHAPPLANISQGPASSHWSLGELHISIHIQNTHLRPSNPPSCLPFRHTQLSSSHLPDFISSLALSHSLRRWPSKYPNILNPTTQSSAKHFHSTNKVRRLNLQRRRLCVPGSRLSVSCLMSGQACFFHDCVRRHDVADGPSSLAPSPAGALTSPKLPSLLLPPSTSQTCMRRAWLGSLPMPMMASLSRGQPRKELYSALAASRPLLPLRHLDD
ncbi:hypothetical protein GQ607_013754, partial [Colletotrichum asianum]